MSNAARRDAASVECRRTCTTGCYGAPKRFGAFGGQGQWANPTLLAAGIIELVGAGLIAVGLWSGYAAFVSSGTMAVACFMAHAPGGFWPIVNKGELAVLYCFIALYCFIVLSVAARGSGPLSVDALTRKR